MSKSSDYVNHRTESRTRVLVSGVAITNPDKMWWPKEGITKLEVAQFYADVAPRVLPWLKGRLLTAERCPDGFPSACFYQKNFDSDVVDVPTHPVFSDSANRVVHYVVGGSKKTLLILINLGCIAMHVMNRQARAPDRQDWLAFDFDPGSGRFADAARVGLLLHKLLEELKIRSYPKTSGGRGLHVFIPLRRSLKEKTVHTFTGELSRLLVQQAPKLATVEMSKVKRHGRVFIDTLRNAFGQTIASPYSVRHRPKAPVSVPLDWDEVDPRLNPAQYNIRTVESRLAGRDPWANFWTHRQSLPDLT